MKLKLSIAYVSGLFFGMAGTAITIHMLHHVIGF